MFVVIKVMYILISVSYLCCMMELFHWIFFCTKFKCFHTFRTHSYERTYPVSAGPDYDSYKRHILWVQALTTTLTRDIFCECRPWRWLLRENIFCECRPWRRLLRENIFCECRPWRRLLQETYSVSAGPDDDSYERTYSVSAGPDDDSYKRHILWVQALTTTLTREHILWVQALTTTRCSGPWLFPRSRSPSWTPMIEFTASTPSRLSTTTPGPTISRQTPRRWWRSGWMPCHWHQLCRKIPGMLFVRDTKMKLTNLTVRVQ